MRITFILAGAGLAGGARVVVMLADYLRRRGHDVLVVFPRAPRPGLRERVKGLLRGRRVRPPAEDVSYFEQPGVRVPYRVLDRHRPVDDRDLPPADVVVATFWLTAEWVARLSPAKGAKAYFIQQLESNFGFPADRVEATWRLPMRKVVCAGWLADLARDRFGDPAAAVVENGVDTDLFHAPPRGKQPRPTVGLLYAPGVAAKGTAAALAVLGRAAGRVPGLRVRAFGTGPVDPRLPLPAGAEYTRTPPQFALRAIYAGCDAWLCTSLSEGFHLPPHEAMACRCPVVSTRVGGPTELVRHGVNGFLTDVSDEAGLTRHLVEVLTADDPSWRAMSEAAHATAVRYTWGQAAARFEQAVRLGAPPQRHPGDG